LEFAVEPLLGFGDVVVGVALAGLVEPDFGEVAIQIMQIFFSFRLTSILPSLDFGDNKLVQVFLFLVDII
jgi:hypothetical protein